MEFYYIIISGEVLVEKNSKTICILAKNSLIFDLNDSFDYSVKVITELCTFSYIGKDIFKEYANPNFDIPATYTVFEK